MARIFTRILKFLAGIAIGFLLSAIVSTLAVAIDFPDSLTPAIRNSTPIFKPFLGFSPTNPTLAKAVSSPGAAGMGLRISDEIAEDMYNYGQFQVIFADGSVGWYEAGWGPMMSETAFFVKDIVSPNGSVSITDGNKGASSDIEGHTKVGGLLLHRPGDDCLIEMPDEPGHQALCDAEQAFMLRAIAKDIDLSRHMSDAVASLAICLAVVVNAGDHHVKACRGAELVRQRLRRRGPAEDEGPDVLVLEVLEGELPR